MAERKGDALRRGTLHLEEIAADAHFAERIELGRQGSRQYRPGKGIFRPTLSERPAAPGKVKRSPEQLKLNLDLRAAHRAVLAQSASQRRCAISTTSSVHSMRSPNTAA